MEGYKIDLKEIGWERVDWINLDHVKGKWRVFMRTVSHLSLSKRR